jgi:hypothetical protein
MSCGGDDACVEGVASYADPVASRTSRVIVSGWLIIERWLDLTSIVLALIRFGVKRSSSGSIVRSSIETAYQAGEGIVQNDGQAAVR